MSIKTRLQRYKYYLRYFSGIDTDPGVRVVIFGQGRSGSTLLEHLMASTGHFDVNGELLQPLGLRFPLAYVCGMAMSRPGQNFLFHAKVWHLAYRKTTTDPGVFLREMSRRGWKIIFLRRHNKFEQSISNFSAEARKGYHKRDDNPEEYQLNIDTNKLIERINRRLEWNQMEEEALHGVPYLKVEYEQDLLDNTRHQVTVDRIMDYLSLERRPCHAPLKKINTRPYPELIENYDEVKKVMVTLGMGDWLNEW